jgi:hypothetical protein
MRRKWAHGDEAELIAAAKSYPFLTVAYGSDKQTIQQPSTITDIVTERNVSVFNKFRDYVAVCVQLYCKWLTVLRLVVAVLHYMFRPTWPSSGVYDVVLLYSWRNLLSCFCCPFLNVVTLYTFSCVFFCCVFSLVLWFLCACFGLLAKQARNAWSDFNKFGTHMTIYIYIYIVYIYYLYISSITLERQERL